MENPATNEESAEPKRGKSMNQLLLMAAFIAIYFALQMVILPKLGVST